MRSSSQIYILLNENEAIMGIINGVFIHKIKFVWRNIVIRGKIRYCLTQIIEFKPIAVLDYDERDPSRC